MKSHSIHAMMTIVVLLLRLFQYLQTKSSLVEKKFERESMDDEKGPRGGKSCHNTSIVSLQSVRILLLFECEFY